MPDSEHQPLPEQDDPVPRQIVISNQTLVPVGVVASVLIAVVGWIAKGTFDRLDKQEAAQVQMAASLNDIKNQLSVASQVAVYRSNDRWTGSDTRIILARWKALNPTLNVPEASDLIGDER